jgi:cytochrome c biogenesis protein CcmG/thiol:disulfide interchange protein DsbE
LKLWRPRFAALKEEKTVALGIEQLPAARDFAVQRNERKVRELSAMTPHASLRIIGLIVLGGALLTGCSPSSQVRAASSPDKSRKAAPDFTRTDANGVSVKLSDYKGKVVLLNFWATWCGPCKIEIPWFMQFEKSYKDRGFVTLGISMDEDGWKAVKPFVSQMGINYPVMLGDDRLAELYGGVDSLPSTFLIDRHGRIAFTHLGLIGKHDYEADIQALLNQ